MFEGFTQTTIDFIIQYGYLALFVFSFLETSMLFPFLPSEIILPIAAGFLVTNPATLVAFAIVVAAGAIVGSLFSYAVFGGASAWAASSFGEYVHVSERDIKRSKRWFHRYGESSVFWGRLLPILRSIISIPAGYSEMDRTKFGAYTAAGSFLFSFAVGAVVYYGKQHSIYSYLWNVMMDLVRNSLSTVLLVVALLIVLGVVALGVGWRYVQYRL